MDILKDEIVKIIREKAEKYNKRVFIVGGVARDLILGAKIKDIDFLIEGNAIDFAQKSELIIKSVHENFNTVKVEIENKEIDIASTRSEKYPIPGGLPLVNEIGISIEDDLKRRDFTINSIAINILTGGIIDPFNGRNDIKAGILNILHDRSFIDDPTRILRGIDFKHRFNFDFSSHCKKLIAEILDNYDNEGLSIQRIYLTLNKIFSNEFAKENLNEILENKIYKIWMKKTELSLNDTDRLFDIAEIFKTENKSALIIMALEAIPYVKADFNNDFEIFNFFKNFKPEQLALYYFKTKDNAALKYLGLKDIKPLITGKTLLENGYQEGKTIGRILNEIEKEKILNPNSLKSKKDEILFALKHFPPLP
ncbi:MAG: hypothetical protein LUE64_05775 [Candidatus Gastranaerophilales bacterium]|nr:hypothetical protein [Candidatus Gastranaerophilales bacterium]